MTTDFACHCWTRTLAGGQLDIGVIDSRDALPRLQHIAVYLGEGLDELHDAVEVDR